jgi:hypothetical protein
VYLYRVPTEKSVVKGSNDWWPPPLDQKEVNFIVIRTKVTSIKSLWTSVWCRLSTGAFLIQQLGPKTNQGQKDLCTGVFEGQPYWDTDNYTASIMQLVFMFLTDSMKGKGFQNGLPYSTVPVPAQSSHRARLAFKDTDFIEPLLPALPWLPTTLSAKAPWLVLPRGACYSLRSPKVEPKVRLMFSGLFRNWFWEQNCGTGSSDMGMEGKPI